MLLSVFLRFLGSQTSALKECLSDNFLVKILNLLVVLEFIESDGLIGFWFNLHNFEILSTFFLQRFFRSGLKSLRKVPFIRYIHPPLLFFHVLCRFFEFLVFLKC